MTSSEFPSLHTPVTGYPQQHKLQGIEFNLLGALTASHAHFSFVGQFQNEEITWDATLLTLERYHAEQPHSSQAVQRSPFLEVGAQTISGRALRVVLDVAQIDEPTILRSIIMIRQYKRLHVGRHEFGVARVFPSS